MILSQYFKVRFFRIEQLKTLNDVAQARLFDWSARLRSEFITDIKVNLYESGRADSFEIKVDDSSFQILDELDFVQKNVKVSIDAGYYQAHEEIVQNGVITFIDPTFGDKGDVTLIIHGQDEGIVLAAPPIDNKARQFTNETLETIVATVAKSRGFDTVFIDPVGMRKTRLTIVQPAAQLDREFLNSIATQLGFKCNVKAGKVIFSLIQKDEKGIEKADIIRTLYYNMGDKTNLLKCDIRLPKRGRFGGPQIPNATVMGIGMDKTETPKLGPTETVTRLRMEVDNADVLEKQVTNHEMTLEARLLIGDTDLVPGYNVMMNGLGKSFSGLWKVVSVHHTWGKDGFRTMFKAKRGIVPGVDTVQVEDPTGAEYA